MRMDEAEFDQWGQRMVNEAHIRWNDQDVFWMFDTEELETLDTRWMGPLLGRIEEVGWKLEDVSYIWATEDGLPGHTEGYFLFRRP